MAPKKAASGGRRALKLSPQKLDELARKLKEVVKSSARADYREEYSKGPRNVKTLEDCADIIAVLPIKVCQLDLEYVFSVVAAGNEADWHLAAEVSKWAKSQALKFRAMLRDLQQIWKSCQHKTFDEFPCSLKKFFENGGERDGVTLQTLLEAAPAPLADEALTGEVGETGDQSLVHHGGPMPALGTMATADGEDGLMSIVAFVGARASGSGNVEEGTEEGEEEEQENEEEEEVEEGEEEEEEEEDDDVIRVAYATSADPFVKIKSQSPSLLCFFL